MSRKIIKEAPGQKHFKIVEFKCPMCNKKHSLMLFEDDILKLLKEQDEGKHIQDIFPDMSPTDREKFITGYCDECQDKIFGTEEEQ